MKKEIIFRPAWDKRNPDPSKNCGIHGVELAFYYGTPEQGMVQFVLYTNWLLPKTEKEFLTDPASIMVREDYPFIYYQAPMPVDLGYHSPYPQYDGQTAMDCNLLTCGKCYYDGSGLNAIELFNVLRREGSDGVWKALEEEWKNRFSTPPTST